LKSVIPLTTKGWKSGGRDSEIGSKGIDPNTNAKIQRSSFDRLRMMD